MLSCFLPKTLHHLRSLLPPPIGPDLLALGGTLRLGLRLCAAALAHAKQLSR